ncbi:MAG TPA: DUF3368 domain-containing protein [Thermodesulfovibrionia bacterium]|nr:DUF3368 domain-containing protein [Thermodesulfovibrionia bacterium]
MIIANSTPLINFSSIGRLDILEQLFGKIYIPLAVEKELLIKGSRYQGATSIKEAKFIQTVKITNITLCNALKIDLDDGEAEAITLTLELNGKLLLIDELKARMVAESLNIPFTGSIGCLVEAKKCLVIPAIKPILDDMQSKARFWINSKLYSKILKDNDELIDEE